MKKKQTKITSALRRYKIGITRYGGETVMGHITKEQYDYWKDKPTELEKYVMGWDLAEYESEHDIPEEAKFKRSWFEIDNIVHINGGEVARAQELCVEEYDENMKLIKTWEPIDLSFTELEKAGVKLNDYACYDADHPSVANQYYFYGQAFNKGIWYTEDPIEITGEFDPGKLTLNCAEVEGWLVCKSINYEGLKEEIYLSEDSTGKSQTCSVNEGWQDNPDASQKLSINKQKIVKKK